MRSVSVPLLSRNSRRVTRRQTVTCTKLLVAHLWIQLLGWIPQGEVTEYTEYGDSGQTLMEVMTNQCPS